MRFQGMSVLHKMNFPGQLLLVMGILTCACQCSSTGTLGGTVDMATATTTGSSGIGGHSDGRLGQTLTSSRSDVNSVTVDEEILTSNYTGFGHPSDDNSVTVDEEIPTSDYSSGYGDHSGDMRGLSTPASNHSSEEKNPATSNNLTAGFVDGCRVVVKTFEFFPWNNEDNAITLETQVTAFKVGGSITPLLCGLGAPLNVLNCIVYFRLGLGERINFLLFSLAFADFVSNVGLFAVTFEYLYTLLLGDFQVNGPISAAMINSGAVTLSGVTYVSGFISTLIGFERWLCITHPLKAKRFLPTKVTGVVVAVATVVITGMHYIISEPYRVGCEYIPALKTTMAVFYPSEFYLANTSFVNVLNGIVFGLCLPLFFVLTTTLTTALTAVKLQRAVAWRQQSSSVQSSGGLGAMEAKELALTRMLIVVSCFFVGCTLPNLLLRIVPLFLLEMRLGGRNQNLLMFGVCVMYIFASINSCLNFFFYVKMGSRFRATLKDLFGLGSSSRASTVSSSSGSSSGSGVEGSKTTLSSTSTSDNIEK